MTSPMFQIVKVAQITRTINDRKQFDQEALTDLAWSIKGNGLAQPITVRVQGDHYELVAGERRLRAMTEILGYEEVPCIVHMMDDSQAAAVMLAENTSRVNLNPMEEAEAYQVRMDNFGWTIDRVADSAGVSKDIVRRRVSLLALRDELKFLVRTGELPTGHAECLATLDNNRQLSAMRILQQSANAMPLHAFKTICLALADEAKEESLFDLETYFLNQVNEEMVVPNRGKTTRIDFEVASDLPALNVKREKGMSAAHAIEDYMEALKAQGMDREAAVIGALYAGLLQSSLMKPTKRVRKNKAQA